MITYVSVFKICVFRFTCLECGEATEVDDQEREVLECEKCGTEYKNQNSGKVESDEETPLMDSDEDRSQW